MQMLVRSFREVIAASHVTTDGGGKKHIEEEADIVKLHHFHERAWQADGLSQQLPAVSHNEHGKQEEHQSDRQIRLVGADAGAHTLGEVYLAEQKQAGEEGNADDQLECVFGAR